MPASILREHCKDDNAAQLCDYFCMIMSHFIDSNEESDAWQRETEGVKPLSHTKASHAKVPHAFSAHAHMPPIKPLRPLPTLPFAHHHCDDTLPEIDTNIIRRIRLGRVPVERTLDLHGMTQASAHATFQQFMHQSYHDGCRLVLVITGKGRVSEQGVLRSALPQWCAESPLRAIIIAVHKALPPHGGHGAYYIRIRKHG
jgi:DNA-nicking Smr family endonuclease